LTTVEKEKTGQQYRQPIKGDKGQELNQKEELISICKRIESIKRSWEIFPEKGREKGDPLY